MALHFIIGGSGSGKSAMLQQIMIDRSAEDEKRQHIIMVPDQFTMQTQKEVVLRHPRKGILNIDVQSFGRLYHRLSNEAGCDGMTVLDDTGKNLILRRLAGEMKDELPVIGSSLSKNGYIHEIKSVISEFMEYGISVSDVEAIAEEMQDKKLLAGKLRDINKLYKAFGEYLGERFITREGRLDALAGLIGGSELMKGAIVGFDCFTGFTPVQYKVIRELLLVCSEVYVNLIIPAAEYEKYRKRDYKDHDLFVLSMKTFGTLEQLAHDTGAGRAEDIICDSEEAYRYAHNPVLAFLEKNIFRSGAGTYTGECGGALKLMAAEEPRAELEEIFLRMREETRLSGLAFRDMAVVTGDLERYAPYAEELSNRYEIPVFLDRSRAVSRNPYAEALRAAMQIIIKGYEHDSVMRLIRSGLSDISGDEADKFDNYLLATGVRGSKNFKEMFVFRPSYMGSDPEAMDEINAVREKLNTMLEPFTSCASGGKAAEITAAVREFTEKNGFEEKMLKLAEKLGKDGDAAARKEYENVHEGIERMLKQIEELIGEEEMGIKEYLEIFDAGLSEIKLGVLPLDADRVVIGDMERTRLKPVKLLFFAGVNDGVIPVKSGNGGVISDLDREYLCDRGCILSPTPREKMFIQRLYLYHALSRPGEQLILSYSAMDRNRDSIRPSYLIQEIRRLIPTLKIEAAGNDALRRSLRAGVMPPSALSGYLRDYASGMTDESEVKILGALLEEEGKNDAAAVARLKDMAFYRYDPKKLNAEEAAGLYGRILVNSVSRIEKFASCPYAHFLKYGMNLRPREEATVGAPDLGSLYHRAMELSGKNMTEEDWNSLSDERARELSEKAVDDAAAEFGIHRLYKDARAAYAVARMKRIIYRSITTAAYQIKKGEFRPVDFEMEFRKKCIDEDNVSMKLVGKIDRLDAMEKDDRLYLKVVDYKSGERSISSEKIYPGAQLQLPVYLEQAVETYRAKYPDKKVMPAALLYFRINDPMIEGSAAADDETIEKQRLSAMRPTGLICAEDEVLKGMDDFESGESDVIHVRRNKGGDLGKYSETVSMEELKSLCGFADKKLKELGSRIMEGDIQASPLGEDACKWCDYRDTCIFDRTIAGCVQRRFPDKKEAWEKIIAEGGEDNE
ncbi:MAG: PD-(D/E)XK nuclease family protein [Lachnospiraceae bacterium]|nr:PD-(D/E)XK nuclease family protein [Lachnospiraceae bacterium]